MTELRDLISYHIQQYSTKSTNCTYLPSIFTKLHFQYIKPHSPIVKNQFFFNPLLKHISSSFYCSFDFYLPIFRLLKLNFFSFGLFHKVLQLAKAYRAKPA